LQRTTFEPIGSLDATRESDGEPVKISVLREIVTVQWDSGEVDRAEGRRAFRLGASTLRVDGEDSAFLTDGRQRYKLAAPL
jgi:hypothetical protein